MVAARPAGGRRDQLTWSVNCLVSDVVINTCGDSVI